MKRKSALLLVTLALVFLVAEISLRFLAPQNTYSEMLRRASPIYVKDDILIKQLRPSFSANPAGNSVDGITRGTEINSMGYRGKEILPASPDRTRIWVVGDSFTFGVGVEGNRTYPALLEDRLLASEPRPVEVINAGVPGRWVDEYYLDLKHRGLDLEPEIVIVGIYMRNDLDGPDARDHTWPEVDSEGLPIRIVSRAISIEDGYEVRKIRKTRWKLPLIRDSHVAQLLYDGGKVVDQAIRGRSVKNAHLYEDRYDPEAEEAVNRVKLLLRGMKKRTEESGAKFVVLLFPGRDQVYPERYEALDGLDLEKPQQDLMAFLEAEGIDAIDLLPVLRASTETERLFLVGDDHWDVGGHAVVAEAIGEHLRNGGYLPTDPPSGSP